MSIGSIVAGQLRAPHGMLGRLFGMLMNRANRHLNAFMKETLALQETDHVLEIGFGDGTLIAQMALLAKLGHVVGIDISEVMVAQAKKANQVAITNGRVAIHQASVADIPYEAESFNKVCSANTIYFWPNPLANIKEISRVLRTGGTLVLGFRTQEQLQTLPFSKFDFQLYTPEKLVDFLQAAGFYDVHIVKRRAPKFDSYCAIATK